MYSKYTVFGRDPLQPLDMGMQELGVVTVPTEHPGRISTLQYQASVGNQHDKVERYEDT